MKTVFGSGNGSDDDGSWLNSLRGRGLFPLLKWGAIGLAVLFLGDVLLRLGSQDYANRSGI